MHKQSLGQGTFFTTSYTDYNHVILHAHACSWSYPCLKIGFQGHVAYSLNSLSYSELKGSLSADFHLKLDSILQLLVSSRPHFIRCIKVGSMMFYFISFFV